jgi:hypothetical protein
LREPLVIIGKRAAFHGRVKGTRSRSRHARVAPVSHGDANGPKRLPSCDLTIPRGTNVLKIRLSATGQKLPSQGHVMPSASYYRRQADLLLSFAVTTENPVVSDRCRLLAEEYQSLAAMLGDDEPEVASADRAQAR